LTSTIVINSSVSIGRGLYIAMTSNPTVPDHVIICREDGMCVFAGQIRALVEQFPEPRTGEVKKRKLDVGAEEQRVVEAARCQALLDRDLLEREMQKRAKLVWDDCGIQGYDELTDRISQIRNAGASASENRRILKSRFRDLQRLVSRGGEVRRRHLAELQSVERELNGDARRYANLKMTLEVYVKDLEVYLVRLVIPKSEKHGDSILVELRNTSTVTHQLWMFQNGDDVEAWYSGMPTYALDAVCSIARDIVAGKQSAKRRSPAISSTLTHLSTLCREQ
jgi:hypothetical protein